MADVKISQLGTATFPPNSGDLVEVVQGGVNKKITYANFTSGLGGGGTLPGTVFVATDPAYGMAEGNSAAANLTALNLAIAALNNSGGYAALYIPAGNYAISAVPDTIQPPSAGALNYVAIYGDGPATRLNMTGAHGTFFTLGSADGTKTVTHAWLSQMALSFNASGSVPPANEPVFVLNAGGNLHVSQFHVEEASALIRVGNASGGRPQRYQVHNITGGFNENTGPASLIDIVDGTSGNFSDIQINAHDLQGGRGIYNHPTSNNDQHWFHNVHFQGGMTHWLDIDTTNGTCFNWVFSQCVLDGSLSNAIFIHSDAGGTGSCTDVHFLDCHCSTWGGTAIHLQNNGTSGTWRSIEVIGGRYKFNNQRGVYVHGSNIDNLDSLLIQGASFLQDHVSVDSASVANNNFTSDLTVDGAGHGLNNGDVVIFDAGETITGVTAGTQYTVNTATQTTFKLTGVTVGSNGTGTLKVKLGEAIYIGNAHGVRIQGCYVGGFYGVPTQCDYAITADGANPPTLYNVSGNVSDGTLVGFSQNLTNTSVHVLANNAVN